MCNEQKKNRDCCWFDQINQKFVSKTKNARFITKYKSITQIKWLSKDTNQQHK